MNRLLAVILGVTIGGSLMVYLVNSGLRPREAAWQAACEGGPLNLQERADARTEGYDIHPRFHCIDKQSFQAMQEQRQASAVARAARLAADGAQRALVTKAATQTLAEARRGFVTQIAHSAPHADPLPLPPPNLFDRIDYAVDNGLSLPAFVSPNPKDRQRYPAIVWLTGGDTNSLGDFWTPGPPSNDQTASAFRLAGVVMMFPVLRGGNSVGGRKQFFYGEVDDVLAAADALARLPYVDSDHIYLGGHSTGGTLALLTAEVSGRFRAVFALGPVARASDYGTDVLPVAWASLPQEEERLRSPIHWLHGITRPTFLIEGSDSGNVSSLDTLCSASRNPLLRCFSIKGLDHFSAIDASARLLAARMVQSHLTKVELDLSDDMFTRNR